MHWLKELHCAFKSRWSMPVISSGGSPRTLDSGVWQSYSNYTSQLTELHSVLFSGTYSITPTNLQSCYSVQWSDTIIQITHTYLHSWYSVPWSCAPAPITPTSLQSCYSVLWSFSPVPITHTCLHSCSSVHWSCAPAPSTPTSLQSCYSALWSFSLVSAYRAASAIVFQSLPAVIGTQPPNCYCAAFWGRTRLFVSGIQCISQA